MLIEYKIYITIYLYKYFIQGPTQLQKGTYIPFCSHTCVYFIAQGSLQPCCRLPFATYEPTLRLIILLLTSLIQYSGSGGGNHANGYPGRATG